MRTAFAGVVARGLHNVALAVPTGTLSLACFAPILPSTAGTFPGVLALSGSAPTVLASRSASPDAGSLGLSSDAPAAVLGMNVVVQPQVAALGLATLAPSVQVPLAAAPGVGALALSGTAPTLSAAFLYDTFTGAAGGLASHVGEVGASWVDMGGGPVNAAVELDGSGSVQINTAGDYFSDPSGAPIASTGFTFGLGVTSLTTNDDPYVSLNAWDSTATLRGPNIYVYLSSGVLNAGASVTTAVTGYDTGSIPVSNPTAPHDYAVRVSNLGQTVELLIDGALAATLSIGVGEMPVCTVMSLEISDSTSGRIGVQYVNGVYS